MVVREHVLDGIRCVQDEHRPAKVTLLYDLLVVSAVRIKGDAVGPHAPGQFERAHPVGRGFRYRRNEPLRRG